MGINVGGFDPTDIFFINKDTGWVSDNVSGLGAGLIKTTNGGLNWTQQLNSSFQPSRLFFINKDTGWSVCNSNKIYRTTNGGGNWNLLYTFQALVVSLYYSSNDTGWVVGGRNNGRNLLRTVDGGSTWDSVNCSKQFGIASIFMKLNTRGWVATGPNIIYATQDGYNWGSQFSPSFILNSIQFVDTSKGWAGGTILIRTDDGGGAINPVKQISNEVPTNYKLYQNYPNPFNPNTIIKYQIINLSPNVSIGDNKYQRTSKIKITVFDVTGKVIQTLVNEEQSAGTYEVDFSGEGLASGIYFYTLIIDEKVIDSKTMVLVK
jgi:hypothetical protein